MTGLDIEDPPCLHKTDLFYPSESGDSDALFYLARQICESCPYQQPCLEYALRTREKFGMWGGATPQQRDAMRAWIHDRAS